MRRRICGSSKTLLTNSRLCKSHRGQISYGRSKAKKTLKEGDLVWLTKDSDERGYFKLGRVTETMGGSDVVIRSATVRTNDGVYMRPVVKHAPVIPGKDVFAMEIGAGNVVDELTNLTSKVNSASRPFQILKLE